MGSLKRPTEGGSGGKRGHSKMEHWETTAEIKDACRIRRRQQDKIEAQTGVRETGNSAPDYERRTTPARSV